VSDAVEDADREDPTEMRDVVVHGHRRAYRIMGDGPPLLLLHGIGDSSESWRPLLPTLAERYTVIAPDLLGHGQSDKPRADYSVAAYANGMRDLLEVLGIDRATVVGHSLGGGVAAQLAYQYPDRVERLVLVATGGVSRTVTPPLRLAAAPLAEIALLPMQLPFARLGGRMIVAALRLVRHDLGRDGENIMRVFDGLPDGSARTAFNRTLRSAVDWRGQVVTMLDRCYLTEAMPTLIVWGDHDGVIPVGHGKMAHAAMPGSRLEIFAGAGHFPHHHDPERFVALLDDFIETTEPAAHDAGAFRELLRRGRPDLPTWLDEDEVVDEAGTPDAQQVPDDPEGDGDLLLASGT
jgi:pimeloyl-ACP methyl ester carboxylesterase